MMVAVDTMAKRISIDVEIDEALQGLEVVTDGLSVRQVLTNLLADALKFSQVGSIAVKARLPVTRSKVCFQVSGHGIGIPSDKLEYIFDWFAQVDHGLTSKCGGAGSGVSICREIVAALGGRMDARGRIGIDVLAPLPLPLKSPTPRANERSRSAASAFQDAVGFSGGEAV